MLGVRIWREFVTDKRKWNDIVRATGQSPQRAVVSMEEEEGGEEEGGGEGEGEGGGGEDEGGGGEDEGGGGGGEEGEKSCTLIYIGKLHTLNKMMPLQ